MNGLIQGILHQSIRIQLDNKVQQLFKTPIVRGLQKMHSMWEFYPTNLMYSTISPKIEFHRMQSQQTVATCNIHVLLIPCQSILTTLDALNHYQTQKQQTATGGITSGRVVTMFVPCVITMMRGCNLNPSLSQGICVRQYRCTTMSTTCS